MPEVRYALSMSGKTTVIERVDYLCDDCETGFMRPFYNPYWQDGTWEGSHPCYRSGKHFMVCNQCNKKCSLNRRYPYAETHHVK